MGKIGIKNDIPRERVRNNNVCGQFRICHLRIYSVYRTVGTGLHGMRDFIDAMSKEHNKVFSILQTDITAPLEVTKKNQSDDKSMVS